MSDDDCESLPFGLRACPMAIKGYVRQPHRKYIEVSPHRSNLASQRRPKHASSSRVAMAPKGVAMSDTCPKCGSTTTNHVYDGWNCLHSQLTAAHARIAELEKYEQECEAAAAILQAALPIGQVKAIGLREVAAASAELALAFTDGHARIAELEKAYRELYAAIWCASPDEAAHEGVPFGAAHAETVREATRDWRQRQISDGVKAMAMKLEQIVCVTEPDRGVIYLSNDSPTHYAAEQGCQVYDHEHFSPLGDALIDLHDQLIALLGQEKKDE